MLAEAKLKALENLLSGQSYGRYSIRIGRKLNTYMPNKKCPGDTLYLIIHRIEALKPEDCVKDCGDYAEHSNPENGCIDISFEVVNKSSEERCCVDKICDVYLIPIYEGESFYGFEAITFCHS